ncbi:RNA polymerase sigma factor [Devosia nitrariae]|uniref:RNA polymerase sigma factor n=2 Tax=Devosia nitrariae TaxID=2071872 RepID=A0ABQ5W7U5_9HYPH|nr:RNA polymerase sigma factor [Devosia nitrariae]
MPEAVMALPADAADADAESGPMALVHRAQKGDGAAFAELVAAHYDMIYRTAYRWCGERSDAEDVAQEVCIKLATAVAGFDGRARFESWLYRVTLNAVRDLQRARVRRGRQVAALAEVSPAAAPPDQEDAAATSQLWRAVRALPEKQRDAVLLIYAEEMTHAAAAEIMGCREATVSWHVFEARKTLRGLL